jgi:hypothetical protein
MVGDVVLLSQVFGNKSPFFRCFFATLALRVFNDYSSEGFSMSFNRVVMAVLFAATCSVSVLPSAAYAEVESSSALRYYNADNIYAVYNNNSALHQAADNQSVVLMRLPIGERVKVLAEPDPSSLPMTEIGRQVEPWLHVALVSDPKTTGYVWAGDLAKTVVDVDLGADDVVESVLTAYLGSDLPSMNPETSEHPVSEPAAHYGIKVLRDGKVIAEKNYTALYVDANSLTTTVYTPAGFSPMLDVISEDMSPEACGVPGAKRLFSWSKGELREGFEEVYISEAAVFSDYFDLVFPLDRGGETNKIKVLRENQSEWDDNCGCYKKNEKTAWDYTWTGTGFTKTAAKVKK